MALIDLSGKVAIITGAARGQGAAEARLFASLGARVVLTDILADEGRQVAATVGAASCFVAHDVGDEDDWAAVVDTAISAYGRVDVLVNNAAICHAQPLVEQAVDGFERMLRVNLIGPLLG
ncbi:MAG TPA: SDR family NAD(P)-dependent oxidoreductase, partial [Mycobacterium sp.]|nr:SDR family NAD(P)-dependent oxidoreductase [Mycobacterium sp.]